MQRRLRRRSLHPHRDASARRRRGMCTMCPGTPWLAPPDIARLPLAAPRSSASGQHNAATATSLQAAGGHVTWEPDNLGPLRTCVLRSREEGRTQGGLPPIPPLVRPWLLATLGVWESEYGSTCNCRFASCLQAKGKGCLLCRPKDRQGLVLALLKVMVSLLCRIPCIVTCNL